MCKNRPVQLFCPRARTGFFGRRAAARRLGDILKSGCGYRNTEAQGERVDELVAGAAAIRVPVDLGHPRRLFPDTLPLESEGDILGLMATENLLLDAEYAKVWERMRRGEWRREGSNAAEVAFRSDGG